MIYALGVIAFVFGLAVSVALHELGHMIPAKRFGVKVTQYFVGFGNTIWSIKRGETEYGLKAIPLGGYVRMVGMLPPGPDGQARSSSTGLFSQLIADAREDERERAGDTPPERLFYRKAVWQKLVVMSGGPFVNLVLAVIFFSVVFMGFGVESPTTTVRAVSDCAISDAEAGRTCTDDDPVAPALTAGLQAGDEIVAFDGHRVDGWDDLTHRIRDNGSAAAEIVFIRDGQQRTVEVTTTVLVRATVDDPTTSESVGFLGVSPEFRIQREDPLFVAEFMGNAVWKTLVVIGKLPERMVEVTKAAFGAERPADGPVSVVGASRAAGELVTFDEPTWGERTARILALLGSLNLFLGLFNLIPLLPLDGGHVAGALWEGSRRRIARLRGRPDPGYVDVAKMLPVAYGVGIILILMSVILIYADIVNPVSLT